MSRAFWVGMRMSAVRGRGRRSENDLVSIGNKAQLSSPASQFGAHTQHDPPVFVVISAPALQVPVSELTLQLALVLTGSTVRVTVRTAHEQSGLLGPCVVHEALVWPGMAELWVVPSENRMPLE